uniref:Uncharacterized protein n=1 Tax=Monopterus albus TaxID=43700 RepID=A0A3Q3J116_MONAL
MCSFYRGTIERVIIGCITVWYRACTVSCRMALQRIGKTTSKIIGAPLPSLTDIFNTCLTRRAISIADDTSHPAHSHFRPLPSGRSLQEELEKLRASHHELKNEKDALALKQQVESLHSEHETENKSHCDTVEHDLHLIDTMKAEKDALKVEKATLKAKKDALKAEKDALKVEKATLKAEKDALKVEKDTLKVEKDALKAEKDTLKAEKDTLKVEKATLQRELETEKLTHAERVGQDLQLINTLKLEKDTLKVEKDALKLILHKGHLPYLVFDFYINSAILFIFCRRFERYPVP